MLIEEALLAEVMKLTGLGPRPKPPSSLRAGANLPRASLTATMPAMKLLTVRLLLVVVFVSAGSPVSAQGLASGNDKAGAQLEALTKKIDEQNTKIDALSQQILKLEQQISSMRPGVMIGETTPAPAPATSASGSSTPPSGNAHVVAKGETLTSIAKTHKVGVSELQKFNQIANDRALQIGQTIMIPTPGASPSPSPTPASPNQ